jgi:hypothetical protein
MEITYVKSLFLKQAIDKIAYDNKGVAFHSQLRRIKPFRKISRGLHFDYSASLQKSS